MIGSTPATVVGTPTNTSIVATVPTLTAGPYSVTVTVAGVVSAASAINVTTGTPAPTVTACTGTVSSTMTITGTNFVAGSTLVTLNGTSVVTTAVTATSITGTVPAAIIAGTPPVVVTVSGQSSPSVNCTISNQQLGGAVPTDIQGNAIPNPSQNANDPVPPHAGPNGANGWIGAGDAARLQNAWSITTTGRCNSTPAITTAWYHNLDYTTYVGTNKVEYFGVNANEALVYSFVAPPENTRGSMQFNESTYAVAVPAFVSISTSPCDFDQTRLGVGFSSPYLGCYKATNGSNTISYFSTAGGASGFVECKLTPGIRYYLNYRNWQLDPTSTPVDSCLATTGSTGIPCGGLITLK